MNKQSKYKVKFNDAKSIMIHLLQEIEGYNYGTISLHKRVIRDLLSASKGRGAYLHIDKQSLLRWMIADAKGKSIHYAAIRFQVVYRYIELLCKYQLLPDNPLREIKPRYGNPRWDDFITALQ